ncbi:CUB and zona pellucida-like domain-containing protein 1 [Ciona intestinalis]
MLLFLSLLPLLLLGGANAQNISVQCNSTSISIIVKRSYLESLVDFSVQTLSYKNTAGLFPVDCLATDDGTNVNYTTTNFSHCSSGNMVFSDHVTYNYTAVLTTSQGSAVVTRDAVYEFTFGCTYSTKYNVSTSNFVSVFKPEVVAGANGTGDFASQIFLTNAMGQPVGSSFKHGDTINVEISAPGAVGVVLKLETCYTSPSSNATNTANKVDLIVGGCAQADTTITMFAGLIVRFNFIAKQFANLTVNQQLLYLHCTSGVCSSNDMNCPAQHKIKSKYVFCLFG